MTYRFQEPEKLASLAERLLGAAEEVLGNGEDFPPAARAALLFAQAQTYATLAVASSLAKSR